MIKGIIFDLWKTLAIIKAQSMVSIIINTLNFHGDREKVRKAFEANFQTSKSRPLFKSCKELCKDLQIECSNEKIEELVQKIRKNKGTIELYPHTINLLKKLRQNGAKIGLISNSTEPIIKQLNRETELLNYVDFPMFSYDTGIIKPDLRIFNNMLSKMNCLPSEAVMVGDNYFDDIEPSIRLGIKTIHFKNYKALISDIKELRIF